MSSIKQFLKNIFILITDYQGERKELLDEIKMIYKSYYEDPVLEEDDIALDKSEYESDSESIC